LFSEEKMYLCHDMLYTMLKFTKNKTVYINNREDTYG